MPLSALLRPLPPPTATPLSRRSFLPHFPPSCHPPHGRRPSLPGGVRTVSHSPSSSNMSVEASGGLPSPLAQDSLSHAKAFWVTRDIIAWKVSEDITACYLYASKCATLYLADSVEGYHEKIQLKLDDAGLPTDVLKKFPHILGYKPFKVPTAANVGSLLQSQLAIASYNNDWKCCDVTSLQLPGSLDDVYAYTGPLGATLTEESIILHRWAPTAQGGFWLRMQ